MVHGAAAVNSGRMTNDDPASGCTSMRTGLAGFKLWREEVRVAGVQRKHLMTSYYIPSSTQNRTRTLGV